MSITTNDTTAERLTHHFMLVIDNEHGDYEMRREMVREALTGDYPVATLRDSLREWAEEMMYGDDDIETMNIMQRELIGVALNSIDWYAMAVRYIEEEQDENA